MLGDMYNTNGEEISVGPIIGVQESMSEGSKSGFIVYAGNITDTKEPYIIFKDYESQQVARISMLEPKYLPSDIKISKDDLEVFNRLIHENWNFVKSKYDFVVNNIYEYDIPLPEDLQCPDYSYLENGGK